MTSQFAALAADVETPFRVYLLHPRTKARILDQDENPAWIDVLSSDSSRADRFDQEQHRMQVERSARGKPAAEGEHVNALRTAALTVGWHLVDPQTHEVMDVPCTEENAAALYSANASRWIFRQVWLDCIETGNFMTLSAAR